MAVMDYQSVKFIVNIGIFGQIGHKKSPYFIIGLHVLKQAKSLKEPFGIGIRDKRRLASGIKQNAVRGLFANAF